MIIIQVKSYVYILILYNMWYDIHEVCELYNKMIIIIKEYNIYILQALSKEDEVILFLDKLIESRNELALSVRLNKELIFKIIKN